jgi:hypothetical protein
VKTTDDLYAVVHKLQEVANDAMYLNLSSKRKCGGSYSNHTELVACDNVAIFSLGRIEECNLQHKHKVHDGWLCLLHEFERQLGHDRAAPLLQIMQGHTSIDGVYDADREDETRKKLFKKKDVPKKNTVSDRPFFEEEFEPENPDVVSFYNGSGKTDEADPHPLDDAEWNETDEDDEVPANVPVGGSVPFVPDVKKAGYCACDWKIDGNPLPGVSHDVRHRAWEEAEARRAMALAGVSKDKTAASLDASEEDLKAAATAAVPEEAIEAEYTEEELDAENESEVADPTPIKKASARKKTPAKKTAVKKSATLPKPTPKSAPTKVSSIADARAKKAAKPSAKK